MHVLLLEEGHVGAHIGEEGHHVGHGGLRQLDPAAVEREKNKWEVEA